MTTISSGLKAETSGRQRIANQMSLIRIALTGLSLLVAAPCMAQGVPDAAQGEIPTCEGFACLDWDRIILEWIRTPGAIANLGSIDIQKDLGGRLDIFVEMSKVVAKAGNQVSILGPCVSACTMAVAFIQQDHLCFGRNASLGFRSGARQGHQCAQSTVVAMDDRPVSHQNPAMDRGSGRRQADVGREGLVSVRSRSVENGLSALRSRGKKLQATMKVTPSCAASATISMCTTQRWRHQIGDFRHEQVADHHDGGRQEDREC